MIPYICPELPEVQKKSLSELTKAPLVYTHVAIRNWKAFAKLGVQQIHSPGSFHTYTTLDYPVSVGKYEFPSNPEDPAVLFMLKTPCKPGFPVKEQYRAGRAELLQTPFAKFERHIREQLDCMLSDAGFNAARDIKGITVNRWAHGYSYSPFALDTPEWKAGEEPWVKGRKPFGRIAIANADSGAIAFSNAAIDQALRAVSELLG